MSFASEYSELRKKRKKSSEEYVQEAIQNNMNYSRLDIAPVGGTTAKDIAPVPLAVDSKKDERTWFRAGAFDDGYQFGDVSKTIIGTGMDLTENLYTGVVGMGEKVVDAGAYLVGSVGGLFGADDFKEDMQDFIKKDLYDERKVAKKITAGLDPFGISRSIADTDEDSLLGEKSEGIVQSGGELLGTVALQAAGVPWFVTTGITSFGGEVENAFNQGATYGEAGISAAITAGAEIVTEKISGVIKFGGNALDDALTKQIARGVSNKAVRALGKLGLDILGEGGEEVLSGVLSALGQKITYADDKELSELFSSDDALESFIGGAVLGGVGSGTKAIHAHVSGVDSVSRLTANEESVVKKEVENRIAEAEKDGKKLTLKEKNRIYDEVEKALKRGEISIDTIESALGSEQTKAYENFVKEEELLKQEIEHLEQVEGRTERQENRLQNAKVELAELQQYMVEHKEATKNTVFDMAKNDRLVESYNEKARRSQVFEADVAKYDEKQAPVIQKAIDSGILNNTRRTHEFVDTIAKWSADTGVSFDFTNNAKLKESGFAIDGKQVDGFITKDGITINIDSPKAWQSTVGHEITHVLEGTELYTEMQNALFEYAKSKKDYDGRRADIESLYKGVKDANIDAELTADLVGDYLFTDESFISNLSTKHRNVFQKIYDEIKHLLKLATAGSKEARELERVKKAFDKVYREGGKAQTDTKYSVSDKNIKDVSTGYAYDETYFTMSYTQDGKTVATLEYGEYDGKPNVKMVEVDPEYRRKGIATKLLQELQKKYPGAEIDFGMTTPDGTKLLDAITYDVTDENIVADRQKLKDLQTELNDLQEKLDVLYDTENLTEAQEVDLHELGDRWQEVYESIRDLEKSLHGKRATKTFVKTDTKYSLSDSDGKKLTKEQGEYFKDSKMRDENGNLKVMYHGSQDAGFHVFDGKFSDDDTSFFFVDRNDVAASYSGTTETYEAQSIRTAEDMNKFIESIGAEGYEVVEKGGKFTLLYEGDRVADSDTAKGIYEEFCWYEGVGDGDVNYKVYLNLTNPLEIDAKGRPWNKIDAEFSQEVYDRYKSLTAEEKAALTDLAEWEDFRIFNSEIQEATGNELASAYAKMGEDCNIYDLFSVAADNFSDDSMRENARKYLKTRDYAQRAKEQGYDGVIFKNIIDNGGYSNGSEGASTVAIAFKSNQIKSVANAKPTGDADIRYSLSQDSDGRKLSDAQSKYFTGSKVVDENGNLKVVYHGSPSDFNTFSLEYLGTNGTAEGYGFYFTDKKSIADRYSKGREGQQNGTGGRLFEVYLDIKKPLSDTEVTMTRAQFKKFLTELNNYTDADGEPLDILSNYGDVSWEGLSKVLSYAMEIEYDGSDSDVNLVHSVINGCGNMEAVFNVLRKVAGYDGIIVNEATWGGDQTIYIAFHPEQIKNVDNLNPTDNPDIRRSLSAEGEQQKRYGNYQTPLKDLALDIAPVAESVDKKVDKAVAPIAEMPDEPNLQDLYNERDALEKQIREMYETGDIENGAPLAERHNELSRKIRQMEAEDAAMQNERLASLDDADAPPETDAPYYGESEAAPVDDPFENRNIKAVGNRKVKAYMYENPEVKPFFQEEANIMLGELRDTIKGEKIYTPTPDGRPGVYGAESYGVWTGTSRHTSQDIAYLLDDCKYTYADIEKGLNAIIEDNGKENNACSKRIEFLLNDRLLKGYQEMTSGLDIPPNQDYINLLNEKQIREYSEEARKGFFVAADEYAPPEDIAPVAESAKIAPTKTENVADDIAPTPTYETSRKEQIPGQRTMFHEGKTAEVLTEEEQSNRKKRSAWSMFKNNVLDKGMVFEDLSLATGNRELQARWNSIRYAEGRAQKLIGEGNSIVSSLNSIRDAVENTGKTKEFYEYLYHLHNVDRMSLESKASKKAEMLRGKFINLKIEQVKAIAAKPITEKTTERTAETIREAREYLDAVETRNKPVFGDSVTAEVSKETAAKLENANPQFREFAKEVYDYVNHLRDLMVENGLISNDTAKLWAEMYPHYVPIRRAGKNGAAINVPLDTGRTGVNAPIKGATGGNSDILPLFDTLGQRTIQTFRAIAKNRFGVELKNTLGTTITEDAVGVDETIDSVDAQDGLLKEGKNGQSPTFTVFEDGKRVEFEITEEMYDALKPTSNGLAYTNKVANTVTNVFRGLLTEYNPVFMATNAVKDIQDVLINSQHAGRTYAAIPKAIKQMATKGHWYQEYLSNGGEQNTYFDNDTNTFKAEDKGIKKLIGMPLRGISFLNNTIERVPRLAEYIASREAGRSIDVAMLDAARVTTNFAAGGDVTKFLNRNGFNFLNASMQGAVQQARNIREAKANGLKGWVQLAAKVALAGLPVMMLNHVLWDDDEEYEELSDYVKQNYYVVAKFGDGKFVRIPKGRTMAVIQDAFKQMENLITGDDEADLKSFLELAVSNLAPNNPLENNILAPIIQVKNNETWYGEDLVPTRLQDLPAAEQFDESTDALSKWLGETTNTSPYKWNYLLNQYTGGVGDVLLPMMTPEAESGDNSFLGNVLAPFKDKFTTDSVMNNQNVSDFYDTVDELTKNAKSSYATDEDVLKYKYMNAVNADLGELYQKKREIQNSDLSDDEKYESVRDIQKQIDDLARESLSTYNNVSINGVYATVGDLHFRWYEPGEDSEAEPGWQKISEKQLAKMENVTDGLGISASEYWSNKEEYDYAYEYPEKYAVAKSVGGYKAFRTYSSELYDIKADKDEDGKSISGSRKEKVIDYVNNLDIDYGMRIILFKSEYNADDTYNYDIIDYLNSREDISYKEMETILKELGFTVDSNGNIYW